MRRHLTLLLAAFCLAALGVTAVALAHDSGSGSGSGNHGDRARQRAGDVGARANGRDMSFFGGPFAGMVLDSLAGRLNVQPADLRQAVRDTVREQWLRHAQAAGLTSREIDALKACRRNGRPAFERRNDAARTRGLRARKRSAACNTDAAKSAIAKLKAVAQTKPDLAGLKADLAGALATKLGKTPEEILAAVRAELDQRLTQAVAIGFITQKGHDLVLACFDDPASCDLTALRNEVHIGH